MTFEAAVKKWGCSENIAARFICRGWIEGVQFVDGQLVVPDIDKPTTIRQTDKKTQEAKMLKILTATNRQEYISAPMLDCSRETFEHYLSILVQEDYLSVNAETRFSNLDAIIKPDGLSFMRQKRGKCLKTLKALVELTAECVSAYAGVHAML